MELRLNQKQKRFYLPIEADFKCLKCGYIEEYEQYVSYPTANRNIELDHYCYECEHEWSENIKINVTVEQVK